MNRKSELLTWIGVIALITVILVVYTFTTPRNSMYSRMQSLDEVFECEEFSDYSDGTKMSIRLDFLLHPEKTMIESLLGVTAEEGDLFLPDSINRSRDMIQNCPKLQALTGDN
jgi:hypothetical protein